MAKAKENSDRSSLTNLWILEQPKFAIPVQNNAYFKQGTKNRIMPTFQTVNDMREFFSFTVLMFIKVLFRLELFCVISPKARILNAN